MKPNEHGTLTELLGIPLNEDVFERILGILEQEQHRRNGRDREESPKRLATRSSRGPLARERD